MQLADIKKSEHVLIVPAHRETPEIISGLLRSIRNPDVLVILVINAHPTKQTPEAFAENELLTHNLCGSHGTFVPEAHATYVEPAEHGGPLLVVGRFREGVCIQGGAGEARDIGCQIALKLMNAKVVKGTLLHCTDADTELPDDFFDAAEDRRCNETSLCMRQCMTWTDDPSFRDTAAVHDIRTRMYTIGLQWAGAPCAETQAGPGLSIDPWAYQAAGGWPHLNAGEDTHLINRLIKHGRVHRIFGAPIKLNDRAESRVEIGFGTLLRATKKQVDAGSVLGVAPDSFRPLAAFLDMAKILYRTGRGPEQTLNAVCKARWADPEDVKLVALKIFGALSTEAYMSLRGNFFSAMDIFRCKDAVIEHQNRELCDPVPLRETLRKHPMILDMPGHVDPEAPWTQLHDEVLRFEAMTCSGDVGGWLADYESVLR